MDQRMRDALDRHITGNYGEDQFASAPDDEVEAPCSVCGQPEFTCQCSVRMGMLEEEHQGIRLWVWREGNENRPDFGNIISQEEV